MYREFLYIKLFPYIKAFLKASAATPQSILLCLLDHSFSSKKQPVKDGEATEGLRPWQAAFFDEYNHPSKHISHFVRMHTT